MYPTPKEAIKDMTEVVMGNKTEEELMREYAKSDY